MNSFIAFFNVFAKSLRNHVYDFLEDCFSKPNLLLVANKLIYLNLSIGISNIVFLHRITTSEVKSRPVLEKIHDVYFMK